MTFMLVNPMAAFQFLNNLVSQQLATNNWSFPLPLNIFFAFYCGPSYPPSLTGHAMVVKKHRFQSQGDLHMNPCSASY